MPLRLAIHVSDVDVRREDTFLTVGGDLPLGLGFGHGKNDTATAEVHGPDDLLDYHDHFHGPPVKFTAS